MKKFLGLLLAGAMLASSFTGCSGKASSSDEKTLLIGGTGPLTGDYATYGISVQQGAQIAVDEINEKGGVNGYTVKLEVEDDQADPQQAVQAYAKLMDNGMNLSLGSTTSGACVALVKEAKEDGIVTMTPSASQKEATAYDNNFRVCFLDPDQGTYSADFIKENNLATKVAVLYDKSNTYSVGVYEAFAKEAEKLGLNIVTTQAFTDSSNTDFSSQIQAVKNSGAELLFMPFYQQEAAAVLMQAQGVLENVTYFGVDGMDGVLEKLGTENQAIANGVMLLTPFSASSSDPTVANFVAKYKEKYNATPDQFAADAYDAVYALCAAFEKAGLETDDPEFNQAVAKAMTEIEVTGATGVMTWSADGECKKQAKAVVISDGAYVDYADYKAQ
ncbi:MAG: ABC transporter substrate-binding protein [Oscillospiraceae bacterium]|nr:ABC transporter substrate-binding protein [Oscillospiraceae bacterium]